MENCDKIVEKYRLLRKAIDKMSSALYSEHSKQMECKKGCAMCCMDYRIFPIEFYSILDELKKNKAAYNIVETDDDTSCIFLKDNICQIYEHRPIICRTHGLPLLYMNDENEWELSACELNFTKFDFEKFTFDNTFPQDKFNSKLFVLNKEFIQHCKNGMYTETDLIAIKELKDQL